MSDGMSSRRSRRRREEGGLRQGNRFVFGGVCGRMRQILAGCVLTIASGCDSTVLFSVPTVSSANAHLDRSRPDATPTV